MLFCKVPKSGQVETSGPAVIERGGLADEILHLTSDAGSHDVFAEVVAYVAAGVRQSIGMLPRLREQQKASGFERRRCYDHHLGADGIVLHRLGINEMHAAGFARLRIDRDFANHRIGAQRQVARIRGRINQAGGRVERGVNVAPAFAFAGAASKATGAVLVVLQAVGGDARTILGQDPAHFLHALLEVELGAVQFGRTLKYAVGQIRKVFLYAGDAEVQIHLVIIRSEVAIADWPIFSVTIAALGFEIVVGKPQRQTSPDVRLA